MWQNVLDNNRMDLSSVKLAPVLNTIAWWPDKRAFNIWQTKIHSLLFQTTAIPWSLNECIHPSFFSLFYVFVKGSSRDVYRRKSIEYEDIQHVLSSTNLGALSSTSELSSQASNTNILDDNKAIGDWLAHPDAISSVRRMRKSTLDQSHRKITRKLSNEQYSSSEFLPSPSSVSRSRSNSLKSRKRSNTISEVASSPTKPCGISRRGGSLKDHTSKSEDRPPRQYSLQELNSKKELGSSRSLSDEVTKIKRKNSQKQTLQRKLSNESTTMSPQTCRKPSIRRKHEASSEECSPVGSPMVKDNWLKNWSHLRSHHLSMV